MPFVTTLCQACGNEIQGYSYEYRELKFCNLKCRDKARDSDKKRGFCKPLLPDLSLTSNLAYILGVLRGDGFCYRFHNAKKTDAIIVLGVNDKEFALAFLKALKTIGLNPSIRDLTKYKASTTSWRVTCSNKHFVDWYKSLTLKELFGLIGENRDFILSFFTGFYDSEGSLYQEIKGSPSYKSRCNVSITNSDKDLMEWLYGKMGSLGFSFSLRSLGCGKPKTINGNLAEFTKEVYRLELQKRRQVEVLLNDISPSITRKQWQKN